MNVDLLKANEHRLLKASSVIAIFGFLCLGLVASPFAVSALEALMVIYLSFAPFFGASLVFSAVAVLASRYFTGCGVVSPKAIALAALLILVYSAWFYGIKQFN